MKQQYFQYIYNLINSLSQFDPVQLNEFKRLISDIQDCYISGDTVYIAGSGACASLAEHAACDWSKGLISSRYEFEEDRKTLKVVPLTANSAVLTAYANDCGFEDSLKLYFASISEPTDMVIIFTTSGNSEFLYRLGKLCEEKKIKCWIIHANENGKCNDLRVNQFYIEIYGDKNTTQIAEDIFNTLSHIISIELKRLIN